MSSYFQRLLKAGGLTAPAPSAAAGPVPEIVELHEESSSQPTPLAPAPSPTVTVDTKSNVTPANAAGRIQQSATAAEETVSFSTPFTANHSAPPPPPVHPGAASAERTEVPAQTAASAAADVPRDVMQAVMKWIAAGQNPPAPEAPASAVAAPLSAPVAPEPAASVRPAPVAPEQTAERVIEIVEEHLDSVPTPAQPPAPSVATPARPPTNAGAIATDGSVNVSIGSIHVRVETPPPPSAPPPARASRPADSSRSPAAGAPTRSAGLSRLRRHYFIPH